MYLCGRWREKGVCRNVKINICKKKVNTPSEGRKAGEQDLRNKKEYSKGYKSHWLPITTSVYACIVSGLGS